MYDAAVSQRLGTLPDIGVSDFAFRPGHRQLAVTYAGVRSGGPMVTAGGVLLFDVNALGKEAVQFRGIPDSDFDPVRVSFSADGGRMAVSVG